MTLPGRHRRDLRAGAEWSEVCERVARAAARTRYWPGATDDDVLQEARIGVAKALRDWDPAAGSAFVPFALLCARRQVDPAVIAASLDAPAGRDQAGDGVGSLSDLLWSPGDDPLRIVIARDEVRRLLARIGKLTPLEREVVTRVALLGEDYDQVDENVKRVDNALQRARRKLRAEPAPEPRREQRVVYIDRTVHPTERQPIAAAMGVCRGDVVAIAKRKLIDGKERAPQGRPDRRGQPVWRIDLQERAA
jgi:RNA polymerase sporulation-specific sigma factor